MGASYTPEQKAKANEGYGKTESYAETLRMFGCPPRRVSFDWVRSPSSKRKPKKPNGPAKKCGWEPKRPAVEMVASRQGIKGVAEELGVVGRAAAYEWARKRRTGATST